MAIWKKIEEFRDFLISSNGKCFSLKTNKMLKPKTSVPIYTRWKINFNIFFHHRSSKK